jgi:hypothetical protein
MLPPPIAPDRRELVTGAASAALAWPCRPDPQRRRTPVP